MATFEDQKEFLRTCFHCMPLIKRENILIIAFLTQITSRKAKNLTIQINT